MKEKNDIPLFCSNKRLLGSPAVRNYCDKLLKRKLVHLSKDLTIYKSSDNEIEKEKRKSTCVAADYSVLSENKQVIFRKYENFKCINNTFFNNTNFRLQHNIDKQKEFCNWYDYSYNRHFSTHDWLAYLSLKIIMEDENLKNQWDNLEKDFWIKPIWTDLINNRSVSRIELMLYGTAAPDYPSIVHFKGESSKKLIYPHLVRFDHKGNRIRRVSHVFTQLIRGRLHYFKQEGIFDDPPFCCKILGNQIIKDLYDENYDLAVFRLGMIAHFIGDCACLPHVIDYYNSEQFLEKIGLKDVNIRKRHYPIIHREFSKFHTIFQWMISERTDGKKGWDYNVAKNSEWNEKDLFEFFHIDLIKLSKESHTLSPEQAAENTAKFTFNGAEFDDGAFMFNNFFKYMPKNWNNLPMNWQVLEPESEKEFVMKIFLTKIQKSLANAINNITSCFNYILLNQNI